MLVQLAALPATLLVEFAWMVWTDGVRSALFDGWDGLMDMPRNFADCWTGKRRLW